MKVLELFSGTASFSKVAQARGHTTCTIDNDPQFSPDYCEDVMEIDHLPYFDVVWASPPCQCFSVASIGHHWTGGKEAYIPKTTEAWRSIELVRHTIDLIEEMGPKVVIIENPRGVLRKLGLFQDLPKTAWYCQYGDERAKPTDFWTNLKDWQPKRCYNGCLDHAEARRGAKTGTQGRKGKVARATVPEALCDEILMNCEKDILWT
jgi:hypothetical protein